MERKQSMIKSIIWRVIGIVFLALVTYAVTGDLITSTLITIFHHAAFIFIYYFHERAWLRFGWKSKKRRLAKMFTYEIILGHCILGLITLVFTGSWTQVTLISVIYIENKLWMYLIYDWLWDRNKEVRE